MEVVLDYNVVFSALYNRGISYRLFMINHVVKAINFLVPEYFWEEMERKRLRLMDLTRLSKEEFDFVLGVIKSQTTTIPETIVGEGLKEALKITSDPKDVPYVSLAIALSLPLVTGDARLRKAVEKKVTVYSPSELLKLLGGSV